MDKAMPKVPDSLVRDTDPSQASLASEGQTSFGMDRQIFADKPILSLAEQRIKAVAEATRTQIAAKDWDVRPLPILPNYQFTGQIPTAPDKPLGPNPQPKPRPYGEPLK